MFNFGGSYGRHQVCYIRKEHGDHFKTQMCQKRLNFVCTRFLGQALFSFHGKTETQIIPKGVNVILQFYIGKVSKTIH